jgi:hypothetical protein
MRSGILRLKQKAAPDGDWEALFSQAEEVAIQDEQDIQSEAYRPDMNRR